jgi:hypothetical protein
MWCGQAVFHFKHDKTRNFLIEGFFTKIGLKELILGYAVAQLVEALPYKPKGRGFDYWRSHWNFSVT